MTEAVVAVTLGLSFGVLIVLALPDLPTPKPAAPLAPACVRLCP